MTRTWDERRHHRNRVIANRLRLIRAIDTDGEFWRAPQYGRLDKTKPYDCSCWMCREDFDRANERHAIKAMLRGASA